jgi:hypothetical protein
MAGPASRVTSIGGFAARIARYPHQVEIVLMEQSAAFHDRNQIEMSNLVLLSESGTERNFRITEIYLGSRYSGENGCPLYG